MLSLLLLLGQKKKFGKKDKMSGMPGVGGGGDHAGKLPNGEVTKGATEIETVIYFTSELQVTTREFEDTTTQATEKEQKEPLAVRR